MGFWTVRVKEFRNCGERGGKCSHVLVFFLMGFGDVLGSDLLLLGFRGTFLSVGLLVVELFEKQKKTNTFDWTKSIL